MNVEKFLKQKGQKVMTISKDKTFNDARMVMNEKRIGALMVTDEDQSIAGIVTERDLLSKMDQVTVKGKIEDLMTPRASLTILSPKASLQEAMKVFTVKRIRHLPVMEGDNILGMISIGDAVKALLDGMELENKYLREYIMGKDY